MKLGDFFTQPGSELGEQVSVECAGDEMKAKKVVHKCKFLHHYHDQQKIIFRDQMHFAQRTKADRRELCSG